MIGGPSETRRPIHSLELVEVEILVHMLCKYASLNVIYF